MTLLRIHRFIAIIAVTVTLFLGTTGSLIELVDMHTIFTHASPFDPNTRAMREDTNGTSDFAVIRDADYLAPALPADANWPAMFATVIKAARVREAGAPTAYAELRIADGKPIGIVKSGKRLIGVNPLTGAIVPAPPEPVQTGEPPESLRNTIKHLHRMTSFGNWALWINVTVAAALVVLIVTGVWTYFKQLFSRRALGRNALFWSAGGLWRTLHRIISVLAALFLSIVVLSGAWLAYESLVFGFYLSSHPDAFRFHAIGPLPDADVSAMVQTTMGAYRSVDPGVAPRVIRLRVYAGYEQGVVITGNDPARQLVFNARTGRPMSLTEPGYPTVGFPFGWQAHQTAKHIHRGDYFGLPGRFMSLIAGLSMIYLSVSGIVMYLQMWNKRRKIGKLAFFF